MQMFCFCQPSVRKNVMWPKYILCFYRLETVCSLLSCFTNKPGSNPVDTFLSSNAISKGRYPALYQKTVMLSCPLDRIKTAWEHDLGPTLSIDLWDFILTSIYKSLLCCLLVYLANMTQSVTTIVPLQFVST